MKAFLFFLLEFIPAHGIFCAVSIIVLAGLAYKAFFDQSVSHPTKSNLKIIFSGGLVIFLILVAYYSIEILMKINSNSVSLPS